MPTLTKSLLFLIILLAIISRFSYISTIPSLNPDEAALGYNAYSLIETGKDEHGAAWPLHFKSFGDFKPGGYVYLALPFVKILGLTPLAVRLPNLILSVLTVYFVFLLVRLVTKNTTLALLSSLVLTFSPWHIHFSRGAWEAGTALAFITIAVYFFLKSVLAKSFSTLYFLFSILFFGLSLYVYHSARIIAPLLALALFAIYRSSLVPHVKKLIIPLFFGLIISLPVAISFLNNGGTTRFGGVGLTADQGPVWRANELITQDGYPSLVNRVIHNKRLLYAISWAQKYTAHFDLNFLFISGDEVPRSKSPDIGQLHLLELPLLILGLVTLLRSTIYDPRSTIFSLSWLFIAPLASSLTFQAPSALRSLPMVIPFSLLIALGLYRVLIWFSGIGIWKLFGCCFLVIGYLLSIIYYMDAYFIHSPSRYPFAWNTGFSQLSSYLQSLESKPANIYITDKYDQPYILMLFFDQYPPTLIQQEIKLTPPDRFGFSTVSAFGPYHFGPINWNNIPSGSMVIAADESIPINPIKTIDFPNGHPGFRIYKR